MSDSIYYLEGVLHVINGRIDSRKTPLHGYTYDLETDEVVSRWQPKEVCFIFLFFYYLHFLWILFLYTRMLF